MKKIFFFFLFYLAASGYAEYEIAFNAGPQFVYHPAYKVWAAGVYAPLEFKYYNTQHKVFTFLVSYAFNYIPASFEVKWFDPVSFSTQQALFSSKNNYHTLVFGPGFEYIFKLNWQKENRKYLKYFYPYWGMVFNFNFIFIGSKYVKQSGSLPDYLKEQYSDKTVALPPTIGASVYTGTKIKIKTYIFDVKLRYSALIPETQTKDLFINHFFQFGIGMNFHLPEKWFVHKTGK